MIPPDKEIYEVEKRITERRHRVESAARDTGRQTLRALTSPWALAGAAVLGFLAAGGMHGKQHEMHVDPGTKKAAKAGTLASIGGAALTWFIKSQFGSPVAMAQYFLAKMKSDKRAVASPMGDSATTRRRATIAR